MNQNLRPEPGPRLLSCFCLRPRRRRRAQPHETTDLSVSGREIGGDGREADRDGVPHPWRPRRRRTRRGLRSPAPRRHGPSRRQAHRPRQAPADERRAGVGQRHALPGALRRPPRPAHRQVRGAGVAVRRAELLRGSRPGCLCERQGLQDTICEYSVPLLCLLLRHVFLIPSVALETDPCIVGMFELLLTKITHVRCDRLNKKNMFKSNVVLAFSAPDQIIHIWWCILLVMDRRFLFRSLYE